MAGGIGNDNYFVDSASDTVTENAGEGTDTVHSTISYVLGANVENLFLGGTGDLSGTGNELANFIQGNGGANVLTGNAGADQLSGGAGNDVLDGGADRDVLTGGTGADQFVFHDGDLGNSQNSADKIADFSSSEGDKIDLHFMDADTTTSGDQAFSFIGTSAFDGHAGELRYVEINGTTFVQGDTNGDGHADFMIRLVGTHALTSGDFVL